MKIHNIKKSISQTGWMVNLIEKGFLDQERIRNIHIGTISPEQIRGNHFHEHQKEWLFIFGGKAEVVVKDKKGEISKVVFMGDDKVMEVELGEAHAIKNVDDKDIYVCALADALFDRESYSDNKKDIIIQ